ncbi:hypothetical protein KGF57_001230 [Candida theae]|uniref:Zn(2)-C6 fungal-type domain-containing protein n=1 Tax=Candida theae TaxID=1198502 RepID=A0AAD5FZY5_9ASCO|nr:uncharacterized protein KGF57_001230 [Candida theae]KAI5963854.1 hypothetical protein KGF57_001230 [Candida theae]
MNANYNNYTGVSDFITSEELHSSASSNPNSVSPFGVQNSPPDGYIHTVDDGIHAQQMNITADHSTLGNLDSRSLNQAAETRQGDGQDQMRNTAARPVTKSRRACDSCSIRKVKCDLKVPCGRCVTHGLECTNIRVKKKCGPKKIHDKTRDAIKKLAITTALETNHFVPLISLETLLPCLNVYQVWYYGIWPVVSVAELISRIVEPSAYALGCAICATITGQVKFMANQKLVPKSILDIDFTSEAIRVKKTEPTLECILTSFFLHIALAHADAGATAVCYLRESITLAQIMGLDRVETYSSSPAETHRMRKIYYLLVVTERFVGLESSLPVILEPSVPFPSLDDEEYSILIGGFKELVKIFAIPNKSIFDQFRALKHDTNSFRLISTVQSQLQQITILEAAPDIQKANILISKYWMMTLTWEAASTNNMIDGSEFCLSNEFPIAIAREFCETTRTLPLISFEFNGPGVCVKLQVIARALMKAVNITRNPTGYEYMRRIFDMLAQLKNEVRLSITQFQALELTLTSMESMLSLRGVKGGYLTDVEAFDGVIGSNIYGGVS